MPGEYIAWVGHRMDYKGATSPLEQWTSLEVRKTREMLRQKKAEQDTWFEEKKVLKSGTRITKLEQAVSDLSVGLIVAILEKSSSLNATDEALEGARQQAHDFLYYGRDMMLELASYLATVCVMRLMGKRLLALEGGLRRPFDDLSDAQLVERINERYAQLRPFGYDYTDIDPANIDTAELQRMMLATTRWLHDIKANNIPLRSSVSLLA